MRAKNNKPNFPVFKFIGIEDKSIIENITKDFDHYSDFNFVSLMTWNINRSSKYSIYDGNLILKLRDYGSKKYVYSILGHNIDDNFLHILKNQEKCTRLDLVPEVVRHKLRSGYVCEDRDNFDYVYKIDKLFNLEGSEFRKFRRSLNSFNKDGSLFVEYKYLNTSNELEIKQIVKLCKQWKVIRGRGFSESSNEYYAIKRAIKYISQLNLSVVCFSINEELVGFVIFEVIGNYSILHFEKCDTRITGLGYFIKYQTINILKDLGVKTLNYEQDLGILGLRQAKISMNPDTYLKKFSIFI